ncbi:putative manganese-dependent inorganic diphosphatase [Novipirellula artificiosorum]|uniref:inorganic diphosphatase n=1 Tax=Novipirellula artificiosorum TaxID=2528016 RepID=A0A5C6DH87_9BACT|nr:putative manganese-dependent inorganic diphosphatase [Novipirellula artificiosorum]TWU34406.1 Cobalt-dependent inorganic pyrophosphatase [Novipirellula artificiosorum]
MTIYVFGHRNPDTDSICSAIAYADFLKRTTRPDAVAASCGAPNQRTEFALRKAHLTHPRIIMDIRPELEDVCQRSVIAARHDDAFFEVYQLMKQHSLRAIPVLDDDERLVGIVSLLDLLELVFQGGVDPLHSREVCSNLSKVASVLGGRLAHAVEPDRTDDFILTVGAMSAEGFTTRLKGFPSERLLVVSGDRPTIQLPALEMGARALVVTGGFELSSGLMQLAQARGVSVIISPYDTATTTMRIKAARLVDSVIERDFVTLPAKLPVCTARQQIVRAPQTVFPVLDNGKLIGVISKSDLVNPPKPEIVLVDHNELSQAVNGAEDADIAEVLDHHRLGGSLRSSDPIRFTLEPVGSTCTLVARKFRQAQMSPSPAVALCMASGIISDTLYLRSPTTTEIDRDLLEWLQQFCELDLEAYANEFFEVGSALRSCTPDEVVREDCKEFHEANSRFSISQIEEIGFDLFWQRKDELAKALANLASEHSLDFSALLVTNIASNGSLLLMSRQPEGWDDINYPELEENLYELEEVVSRKKQLLPLIISLLDSAPAEEPG